VVRSVPTATITKTALNARVTFDEARTGTARPYHRPGWGQADAADAEALRGVPVLGRGIGGAIKGTVPGANLR
jgi:hypothetical protein